MCFNPGPEKRVPSPNRYIADAKFCFCKNNKRMIIIIRCFAVMGLFKQLMIFGKTGLQGLPTRVTLFLWAFS